MPSRQVKPATLPSVAVVGEVLWDIVGDSRRLGGAPLNFSAQLYLLGHPVRLISAVGDDEAGATAVRHIRSLGLGSGLLQTSRRFATGTALARIDSHGDAEFEIPRPAAFDDIDIDSVRRAEAGNSAPAWLYFGSLLAATVSGRDALDSLLSDWPAAKRLVDLNLRPGSDSPELMLAMLERADVAKLNEVEVDRVRAVTGLPEDHGEFCLAACDHFGWEAAAVTLGADGCVVLANGDSATVPGVAIEVADTVGAGDAFAAGFLHGLACGWPAQRIGEFANSLAATVVGHSGSLPVQL